MQRKEIFPKSLRILDGTEFKKITSSGRKLGGRFFLLFARRTEYDRSRLGITVSRKVGNAVVRNRVKRQIREFFRRQRPSLLSGYDWVVIARAHAGISADALLRQDLHKLFAGFSQ
ncbi:ribonuclease P protein component [Candidatus Magnetaquicoccus inordinatus]|uniref:ribonuclease P protein component n=1 Tax=Candidatus Magnetaquicoccus inordinatus TaxID=2496818 RepID=UPI00102B3675|nr:ribonuclease P protein component [Candidatus Magnetaquicoccus inordinatus]